MTSYWRRQTVPAGNYPPQPQTSPGVPYYSQTLAPREVVGRLAGTPGPTERIPFDALAAALIPDVFASKVVQVVTAAGPVTVNDNTQVLLINKSSASSTAVTLPSVADRNKIDLEIFDWTGLAGDITLTPAVGETIMGLSSWVIGSGGVSGSGGSLKLTPLNDIDGWLVR